MKFIDLSHLISNNISTYPSDPDVLIKKVKGIKEQGSLLHSFSMGSHTGTHLDTPSHIIPMAKTLNDFDLDSFTGQALKVDKNSYRDLNKKKQKFDGIIFETGWYKKFKYPSKFYGSNRPVIPDGLIEIAMKSKIKFFGCDLPSVDKTGSKNKSVHNALLGSDIIIYESLNNLSQLPLLIPFQFYGFPLPLDCLEGSPVRALALLK